MSVISLNALNAFKDLVNLLRPPMNIKPVVTLTITPTMMMKSRKFQILFR
jgi:hypothetical protein